MLKETPDLLQLVKLYNLKTNVLFQDRIIPRWQKRAHKKILIMLKGNAVKTIECQIHTSAYNHFLILRILQPRLNFYEMLNIPRTASEDQIKKAYKNLARCVHPDKNPHKRAPEAFRGKARSRRKSQMK